MGGPSQLTHNYYQMVVIVRKDTRWRDRVKTRAASPASRYLHAMPTEIIGLSRQLNSLRQSVAHGVTGQAILHTDPEDRRLDLP